MDYNHLKEILTWLIPLVIIDLSISFVKVVFVVGEGSVFKKFLKFCASVVFGVVVGSIIKLFFGFNWALVLSPIATLLADQITNKIDKAGLNIVWKYVKIKTNTEDIKDDNPPDDGK